MKLTKADKSGGAPSAAAFQSKANDRQPGGDHYIKKTIQPWDYILAIGAGFLDGNVIKYVSRFRDKNGLEDLEKAKHYLDKLIEVEKAKVAK